MLGNKIEEVALSRVADALATEEQTAMSSEEADIVRSIEMPISEGPRQEFSAKGRESYIKRKIVNFTKNLHVGNCFDKLQ